MKSQPESTKKHTFNVVMQNNCNHCIKSTTNHTSTDLAKVIKERKKSELHIFVKSPEPTVSCESPTLRVFSKM